jgi:hypothetical protein
MRGRRAAVAEASAVYPIGVPIEVCDKFEELALMLKNQHHYKRYSADAILHQTSSRPARKPTKPRNGSIVNDLALRPEHLNIISLCTGGGGLDLGVELAMPGARSVVLVEREAFACSAPGQRDAARSPG